MKICMNEDPAKRPKFDMIVPILEKMQDKWKMSSDLLYLTDEQQDILTQIWLWDVGVVLTNIALKSHSHTLPLFSTPLYLLLVRWIQQKSLLFIFCFFSSSVKVISKFCYWSADTVCRSIVFTVHCINCNHIELSKISSDKITRGGQHDILLNSFSGGPAMLILAVLKSLPLRWLLLLQWWSITNG